MDMKMKMKKFRLKEQFIETSEDISQVLSQIYDLKLEEVVVAPKKLYAYSIRGNNTIAFRKTDDMPSGIDYSRAPEFDIVYGDEA
jgi:hypothetical protein